MLGSLRKISWYAFAFLLPWQTVWIVREVFVGGEKWQYATFGIYASDVALLVFFTLSISLSGWNIFRASARDVPAICLGTLFVWTMFSMLWAIRSDMAILSAWHMLLLFLAYLSARFGGMSTRVSLWFFIASMSIQAMMGVIQWTLQYVPPSTLFGIAEHESWRAGASVLKTEAGRFLRAYGGFEHPNVFGGSLAASAILSAWFAISSESAFRRRIFISAATLFSFVLALTFSRSGWMAFWFGTPALFFLCAKKIGIRDATPILFVSISFLIAFFLVRDIASSRFSEETLLREGSFSDRVIYLDQAVSAIREHSILGVGGGNFTAFSRIRFPESGTFIGAFQPVHTVPLLIFSELGIFGFALFVFLLANSLFRAFWEKRELAIAILFAFFPMLFLDHFLWSSHFGAVSLGFLLGIIERRASSRISTKESE